MDFPTMFKRPKERVRTCPGTIMEPEYNYEVDEKGIKKLVITGYYNIKEEIQSYADSCDINLLMQRFQNGDLEAINVRAGQYLDARELPASYAELFDRVEDCKRMFDELPADLRKKFNNSYIEFWSNYGNNDFNSRIDEYNSKFVDHSFDHISDQELEVKEDK